MIFDKNTKIMLINDKLIVCGKFNPQAVFTQKIY